MPPEDVAFTCGTCGFSLWNPIAETEATALGLYDDARFPGQCLLCLKGHHEDFTSLDQRVADLLMADARSAGKAIQAVTGATRINYAILGNAEPHVHVHIIPRHPSREPRPHEAPWSDPRPREQIPAAERAALIEDIAQTLGGQHHDRTSRSHAWSRRCLP